MTSVHVTKRPSDDSNVMMTTELESLDKRKDVLYKPEPDPDGTVTDEAPEVPPPEPAANGGGGSGRFSPSVVDEVGECEPDSQSPMKAPPAAEEITEEEHVNAKGEEEGEEEEDGQLVVMRLSNKVLLMQIQGVEGHLGKMREKFIARGRRRLSIASRQQQEALQLETATRFKESLEKENKMLTEKAAAAENKVALEKVHGQINEKNEQVMELVRVRKELIREARNASKTLTKQDSLTEDLSYAAQKERHAATLQLEKKRAEERLVKLNERKNALATSIETGGVQLESQNVKLSENGILAVDFGDVVTKRQKEKDQQVQISHLKHQIEIATSSIASMEKGVAHADQEKSRTAERLKEQMLVLEKKIHTIDQSIVNNSGEGKPTEYPYGLQFHNNNKTEPQPPSNRGKASPRTERFLRQLDEIERQRLQLHKIGNIRDDRRHHGGGTNRENGNGNGIKNKGKTSGTAEEGDEHPNTSQGSGSETLSSLQ